MVDNSESLNSSSSRYHNGSKLSGSSGGSESASSLVASGGSGDNLKSVGEAVSSSSELGHGDRAGVNLASTVTSNLVVEVASVVLLVSIVNSVKGRSTAVAEGGVSSDSSVVEVSTADKHLNFEGIDGGTSVTASSPGNVNTASGGSGLGRVHLARDSQVGDSSHS